MHTVNHYKEHRMSRTINPLTRSRDERIRDSQANDLQKTTSRTAESAESTEALLAKLVGKVHLSNILAIAGNDMFTREQRQAAVDMINRSTFEPDIIHPGRR